MPSGPEYFPILENYFGSILDAENIGLDGGSDVFRVGNLSNIACNIAQS
jgi:hypothetical protein